MPFYRLILCAPVAGGLFLAGCGGSSSQTTAAAAGKSRPDGVPVNIAKVTVRDVPVELQVIGNVEASTTIMVKAQVSGELTKVGFKEGDYVNKGDLLFTIDRRPLEASAHQAEANLARDEAALGQAQANFARDTASAAYARSQADRYERLFKEGITSREQVDQFRTNADAIQQAVNADKAAIESARAAIAAAKATEENAKVQLGYTEIRSPITGRTGNLNVKQGNIVNANTTELMSINAVQPIFVTFAVPESELQKVKRFMDVGRLPVLATPQNDTSEQFIGTLTFVDNSVDPSTGTIKLKGTFPNAERRLWPGEFVRVVLRLTTQRDAVIVPNQAVQSGQNGNYVFVVKDDRSVEMRPVKTGGRSDQDLVVEAGLRAGETVVTEGQLRLAPGMKVIPRDGRGVPGGQKRSKS